MLESVFDFMLVLLKVIKLHSFLSDRLLILPKVCKGNANIIWIKFQGGHTMRVCDNIWKGESDKGHLSGQIYFNVLMRF